MSELWLYEWPNGQASIVHAEDEEDAALILEQLGPTDSSEVQPYDGELYVTFTVERNPDLGDPEWQTDPYDFASDVLETLEEPEKAILKYGDSVADKTAPLAGQADDEDDDPSEIVRDLAHQFRKLADKAGDGDKRTLWLDAARGMDVAAEALDNLALQEVT